MTDERRLPEALAPLSLPPRLEQRLDNGLTVLAAERSRLPLASACLVLPAGSARDPKGKAGLTDFVVELLRRGTERYSARAIDEAVELMGVDLRLECSPDATYLTATAPSEHLPTVLSLMAELVESPAFEAKEVEQGRKRTVARLMTELDDPTILAADAVARVGYGKHPYARPGRGLPSEVATFTRRDCRELHAALFRPTGAFLALCGDVPAPEAVELVARSFGGWKGSARTLRPLPPVPPIQGTPLVVVDRPDSTQAQIRLASLAPGRLHPKLIASRLACSILGGGFTSRLVDAIRVTRGLSYGVSSNVCETEAGGLFFVSSFTKTETARELVDVALEETRRYRDEGPTPEELTRAQRYSTGLFPLAIETVDQLARALADTKRFGRAPDWIERYRERILEVGLEEVRGVARDHFLAPSWAGAVVGNARELAVALGSLGRVRVIKAETLR